MEQKMTKIVADQYRTPLPNLVWLVMASNAYQKCEDIFFLVMAALGLTSPTTSLEIPFDAPTFSVSSHLSAPIYVFL
jgi:hypothetical protein